MVGSGVTPGVGSMVAGDVRPAAADVRRVPAAGLRAVALPPARAGCAAVGDGPGAVAVTPGITGHGWAAGGDGNVAAGEDTAPGGDGDGAVTVGVGVGPDPLGDG